MLFGQFLKSGPYRHHDMARIFLRHYSTAKILSHSTMLTFYKEITSVTHQHMFKNTPRPTNMYAQYCKEPSLKSVPACLSRPVFEPLSRYGLAAKLWHKEKLPFPKYYKNIAEEPSKGKYGPAPEKIRLPALRGCQKWEPSTWQPCESTTMAQSYNAYIGSLLSLICSELV